MIEITTCKKNCTHHENNGLHSGLDMRQVLPSRGPQGVGRLADYLDDVQRLNEKLLQLLLHASVGEAVRRLLEVSAPVARLLCACDSHSLATAIHCGAPLVLFAPALDEVVHAQMPRSSSCRVDIPAELQEFTRLALRLAHDVALRDLPTAQVFFGLSHPLAESLGNLGVMQLETLCCSSRVLLTLRDRDSVATWQGLLAGNRFGRGKGLLLSRMSALGSLCRGKGSRDGLAR
jgi:hypothetical protein